VIPAADITAWGVHRPWPTRDAIEQDLLLARLIVEIYQHPLLREELVFRGGTCLHQLHLASPLRYSEDLDFVRRSNDGIGPVFDALREVAGRIGLEVYSWDLSEHPKFRMRVPAESGAGALLRIKVEINTHETTSAMPLVRLPFRVSSKWFSDDAEVLTFAPEELMATKLRALYQRKKGRDVFDLWLALTEMALAPDRIIDAFGPYHPNGYTQQAATNNLIEKLEDESFRSDLDALVIGWPKGYDIDAAGHMVIHQLFALL
jgi:predicted nucleotidyltransferase component of viral defense system